MDQGANSRPIRHSENAFADQDFEVAFHPGEGSG